MNARKGVCQREKEGKGGWRRVKAREKEEGRGKKGKEG